MRIFTRVASLAAMWFFIFACSEGTSTSTSAAGASTGSGGADTGVDAARSIVDTFCNTVAAPFCEAYITCCDYPSFWLIGGQDVDDTTAIKSCSQIILDDNLLNICQSRKRDDIAAHLRNGLSVFDQGQFDTCLTLFKSMTAGGAACVEPAKHVLLTTCRSAFRGQIALGDTCPYMGDSFGLLALESAMVCKDGRCENGKCVPFLKPGEACDLSIDQQSHYDSPAPTICNFLKKEVCWGDPGAGGAGGGGGAGGAAVMGTCRPEAEPGDTCNPANNHECKSYHCDATGKCALTEADDSACHIL